MIIISVVGADATVTQTETLTAGRVGLECEFTFDNAWDGLNRIAVCEGADTKSVIMPPDSDVIVVPWECLESPGYKLRIGVRGEQSDGKVVIPTVWARVGKIMESPGDDVDPGQEATPSVVMQIQQTAANALLVARESRDAAVTAQNSAANSARDASSSASEAQLSANQAVAAAGAAANSESEAHGYAVYAANMASNAEGFESNAANYANYAGNKASEAVAAKNAAVAAKEAIEDMGVATTSVAAGSDATVTKSVDQSTGAVTLTFGLPGSEIFWATYGTTTAFEIRDAVDAGKEVLCNYNSRVYRLSKNSRFTTFDGTTLFEVFINPVTGEWNNDTIRFPMWSYVDDALGDKVDIDQGVQYSGKVLGIGSNGKVTPVDAGGGGSGLPTGGYKGEVLKKQSDTDGDADWEPPLLVIPVSLSGTTATANKAPADVWSDALHQSAFVSYSGSLVPCVDSGITIDGHDNITDYSFWFRGPIVDSNGNLKIAEFTFEEQAAAATTMTGTGSVTSVGGSSITVDSSLSDSSENPVQNKIIKAALDAKGTYSKPSGGIPKTDLASAVQTSLGKADTALQSYTETDPTVPSWAKASSKPSYTASEVGAIAAPSSPATGAFLVWNGSAWTAQTLSTWQGGNY